MSLSLLRHRRRPDPPAGAPLSDVDRVDRALGTAQKLAVLTSAIASLESLVARDQLQDDGPYSWRVSRTRTQTWHPALQWAAPLFAYPAVLTFPAARLLAATRLLVGHPGPKERASLAATVLGTSAALQVHHHYGSDGADQVSSIALITTVLAQAFPHDERARRACLRMMAFQSCLSYSASGAIKLSSRTWRSGDAITGVFRTATFGDEWFYRTTQRHPAIPRVLAWMVILGELFFPLVLVTPTRVSRGILALMGSFHLANSRFMGLNRFPFAFAANYPALAYVQKER